ncbi:4-coumarate--CoA ligase 7-like protein, partial [Tanacetum coccineum]
YTTSPNSILFPVAFLSVTSIGAIVTTANPLYTVAELTHQVNDSKPKLIITVEQLVYKVNAFNIPIIDLNCLDQTVNKSVKKLGENVNMDDVAAILYSSGTTGLSKGVVLTHRSIIATSLRMTSDQEMYNEGKCVFLCVVPLFHIMGLVSFTYSQLQLGNAMVVMNRFELEEALEVMERFRVTHLYTAPPVVMAMDKKKEVVGRFDVSALREIASGAAPLGKDVLDECSKVFPQAMILQGYGMTESGGIISLEDPRVGYRHSGSSGTLFLGMESQIIHIETLKPLPINQLGEIWVCGPNLMQEYLHNKEATEQAMDKQGWLHTGDLGYFDEEGRIYVVDRLKELIKYKGYKVAPAELEGLLVTHPKIMDAAVIPACGLPVGKLSLHFPSLTGTKLEQKCCRNGRVREGKCNKSFPTGRPPALSQKFVDDEAGEIPKAFVVPKLGSKLTGEEVQDFIAKQVAPFKRIRKVEFVDIILRAASGKILRRELKQRVQFKL